MYLYCQSWAEKYDHGWGPDNKARLNACSQSCLKRHVPTEGKLSRAAEQRLGISANCIVIPDYQITAQQILESEGVGLSYPLPLGARLRCCSWESCSRCTFGALFTLRPFQQGSSFCTIIFP